MKLQKSWFCGLGLSNPPDLRRVLTQKDEPASKRYAYTEKAIGAGMGDVGSQFPKTRMLKCYRIHLSSYESQARSLAFICKVLSVYLEPYWLVLSS
ncbi:hypothetical protein K1719_041999 [Acacia pycnantha]|nr:hypothetical protein K1719_041999 [Acacia pycnantha]